MPNRQRKYINIETLERNCTKEMRQYVITKYAEKNSLTSSFLAVLGYGHHKLA